MNWDEATIARLVQEVLEQVSAAGKARPVVQPETQVAIGPTMLKVGTVITPLETKSEIACDERIITANLLAEKVKRGQRLVIGKQSLITPAAHDYLKQQRIDWSRGTETSPGKPTGSTPKTSNWRILINTSTGAALAAVSAVEKQTGTPRQLTGGLNELTETAISQLTRKDCAGLVALTQQPQILACRANRQAAIRACEVRDLKSWEELRRELNPNLVAINPMERNVNELRNLLLNITR